MYEKCTLSCLLVQHEGKPRKADSDEQMKMFACNPILNILEPDWNLHV